VRNPWANGVIKDWNHAKMIHSFDELNKLAQELPGNVGLLNELKEDLNAVKTSGSRPLRARSNIYCTVL